MVLLIKDKEGKFLNLGFCLVNLFYGLIIIIQFNWYNVDKYKIVGIVQLHPITKIWFNFHNKIVCVDNLQY